MYLKMFALCALLLFAIPTAAQEVAPYKDLVKIIVDQSYNLGDFTLVDASFAPDFIRHPGESNLDSFKISALSLRAALPDLTATIDLVLQESSTVFIRFHLVGTFTNEFVSPDALPVAPTNQPVQVVVQAIYRFNEGGQIAEEWDGFDNLSFLGQMGAIPAPANLPEINILYPDLVQTGLETQNKTYAQWYIDAINQNNFTPLDTTFKFDYIAHNPFGSFDRAGMTADWQRLRGAMPDLTVSTDIALSEGNWAASVYTMRGTFTGNYTNADGSSVPPTNQPLQLDVVALFRFEQQGLVAESWELYDSLSFLTQLGVITVVAQDGQ